MLNLRGKKSEATDVVVHEVEIAVVHTDPASYSKLGWLIVILGFGGGLLWATFAPLDKGVPMSGTVAVATNRKAVQHLSGGTIAQILVKEGDIVKQGQVLVRMNDTQNTAAVEITRVGYFSARATEARLIAERDGKKTIAFPPELASAKKDPRVAADIAMQAQLFSSRQSAAQNELASFDENVSGLKAQLHGLDASRESKKQQKTIFEEQLVGMRELAKDGYVARGRLLDLERAYAQINGQIAEDIGNIGRIKSQIVEVGFRRQQRQQEYQKDVRTQLGDVGKEADELQHRLTSQAFDLANTDVKSPSDGIVVGMNIFTQGGVVNPGFKMMDIVPVDDALIVEGQLPVNLVDKVHPGLKVNLIFSAFNQNKTPQIPGEVTGISADRLIEERSGAPYYKVKAKVAPEGLKMLAKLKVLPGMPVELFVKTGERTMMNYLLKPIFDRAHSSMTEE
jgi:protease secretion system membrane fusion protein